MPANGVSTDVKSDAPDRQPVDRAPAAEKPIPLYTRFRIGFVRSFLMLWIRCFSLSGLYILGRAFGTLEYLIDYRRRKRVHRALYAIFKDEHPPEWYRRMSRRYFMRIRCDKMFYTIMDRIPRDKLMNRIKPKGAKYVDAALQKGNGVYIALCHYGSFHVAGLLAALLGYDIVGVRDPKESPVRRYIVKKYNETFPEVARMKLFYSGQFPREIYRQFKANGVVASLLDVGRIRGEHLKTCPVKIFGETREFLVGPVQMAIRAKAPMVQSFVVSRKNFYYQLVGTPPLYELTGNEDEEALLPEVMQRYADGVEAFAREHPDHLMNI